MSNSCSEQRLLPALQALRVPDTADEHAYDDITCMAANLCGTPFALSR